MGADSTHSQPAPLNVVGGHFEAKSCCLQRGGARRGQPITLVDIISRYGNCPGDIKCGRTPLGGQAHGGKT